MLESLYPDGFNRRPPRTASRWASGAVTVTSRFSTAFRKGRPTTATFGRLHRAKPAVAGWDVEPTALRCCWLVSVVQRMPLAASPFEKLFTADPTTASLLPHLENRLECMLVVALCSIHQWLSLDQLLHSGRRACRCSTVPDVPNCR